MNFSMESNRIYKLDESGRLIAEVTVPSVSTKVVNINHTFVDESLKGQGIADKLMKAVVYELRETGKKARTTCPYATKWFERHPEAQDVYTTSFLE